MGLKTLFSIRFKVENFDTTVSVIIPTLNRSGLLPRALRSVLSQTRPADEVIVVDNGSTDGTLQMLSEKFPEVKVFSEPKKGVSASRNLGIALARYNWIAFLDSDDEWHQNKLDTQMRAHLRYEGYRLSHTDEIWVKEGKRINQHNKHKKKGGYIFENCLKLCCISPSSVLINRNIFRELGGFDDTLPACEDYDMWLRVTSREPVLFVSEPLTIKYGGHSDQLSKYYWGMDRFRVRALEKLLALSDLNEEQTRVTQIMLMKKLNILFAGATKRGNQSLLKVCERKLEYWEKYIQENQN